MSTIFDKWYAYRKNLPSTISKIQHDETKKAFWCGMAEMFSTISEIANAENADTAAKMFQEISSALQIELKGMIK